ASEALFTHGGLTDGQSVLIHGAGGGVGTAAVQLGRAAGARGVASGRSWARDSVRELGAREFIDGENESLSDAGEDVDLVFDLVGGDLLGESWSVIRPGGRIVSVVEDPAVRPEARSDAQSAFFVVEFSGGTLEELATQVEAGELRPVVGDVHGLADGR